MLKVPPNELNGRLGAGALLQIGHLAGADALDQLGQIDAFDRAVGDVDAAIAGERMLDIVAAAAGAAQLQGDIGAPGEQIEPGGAGEKRLHRYIVELEIAVEGRHGLRGIDGDLAAALPVIKLHAAESRVEHAVAQGQADRGRPDSHARNLGLAHIHVDVGIEGGRDDIRGIGRAGARRIGTIAFRRGGRALVLRLQVPRRLGYRG